MNKRSSTVFIYFFSFHEIMMIDDLDLIIPLKIGLKIPKLKNIPKMDLETCLGLEDGWDWRA